MLSVIEDNRNEFKIKLSEDFKKEVIAFLNTEDSNIFVCVDDKGNINKNIGDIDLIQRKIKERVKTNLKVNNNKVDIVLSHTCPCKYLPYEAFLDSIDQSTVDNSTKKFLDEIENNIKYDKWYCGHYHIDKKIYKIRFMMNNFDELL